MGSFCEKSQNPGSWRTLGTNWQSLYSHQDHHPRSWRMSSRPAQLSLSHSGQNADQGERSGPWVWARPEDRGAPWDAPFYLVFVVIISDWSIIAVQCCPTGISYKYTYIPSLLSLPPCSIPPLWVITEHQAELPLVYRSFPLASYFIHGICLPGNAAVPVHSTLPSPTTARLFCVCDSFLPCK